MNLQIIEFNITIKITFGEAEPLPFFADYIKYWRDICWETTLILEDFIQINHWSGMEYQGLYFGITMSRDSDSSTVSGTLYYMNS
jgi:hypothetical protein